MKTRLGGGYLMERKPWTAMARALLELIAYGLRVLLSLLPPPPGYKAIYLEAPLLDSGLARGEVPERLKGHDWKSCRRA